MVDVAVDLDLAGHHGGEHIHLAGERVDQILRLCIDHGGVIVIIIGLNGKVAADVRDVERAAAVCVGHVDLYRKALGQLREVGRSDFLFDLFKFFDKSHFRFSFRVCFLFSLYNAPQPASIGIICPVFTKNTENGVLSYGFDRQVHFSKCATFFEKSY